MNWSLFYDALSWFSNFPHIGPAFFPVAYPISGQTLELWL